MSPDDGQVVAQQLKRDDVDDGLQGVHRLGDLRDGGRQTESGRGATISDELGEARDGRGRGRGPSRARGRGCFNI